MLTLESLGDYARNKANNEKMTSITVTFEFDADTDTYIRNPVVNEIYKFSTEDEADQCIDKAKKSPVFHSCVKLYKAPKTNKDGEVKRDGYWQVKIGYKDNEKRL